MSCFWFPHGIQVFYRVSSDLRPCYIGEYYDIPVFRIPASKHFLIWKPNEDALGIILLTFCHKIIGGNHLTSIFCCIRIINRKRSVKRIHIHFHRTIFFRGSKVTLPGSHSPESHSSFLSLSRKSKKSAGKSACSIAKSCLFLC